jgi:phosphinothricin acetyltransferase
VAIRKAKTEDLPAIVSIYNQAITARGCTGDTVCVGVEERASWFEEHSGEKTPVFVYETEHGVAGYGYISPYRPGRQAFERVGEVSYYVDFSHHKRGIGSQLLEHLISEASRIGYTHLVALLLDCNSKSVCLLEKYGFSRWGTLPGIACCAGERYSPVYLGLALI